MRKSILFLLFVFIFMDIFTIPGQALTSRKTILQLLQEYSPTGHHLVRAFMELPRKRELYHGSQKIEIPLPIENDFMIWVKDNTEEELLNSICIVVHETSHFYTNNMAYHLLADQKIKVPIGDQYDAYYFGGSDAILVKTAKVFNTKEIASSIPENLRTFRFSYINAESPRGSQVFGIYGLLDEFHAYYHDTKTAIDLYPHYRDKMTSGVDRWITYLDGVNAVYFAYPEFKFFILKYLQYAKIHYPGQYREIIENNELIKAFFIIDQNYAELIARYYKVKEEIFEGLQNEGYTVTEKNNRYQIARAKPPFFRSAINYSDYYEILRKELQKEEYRLLLNELKTD